VTTSGSNRTADRADHSDRTDHSAARAQDTLSAEAADFYRRAMAVLEREGIPFLVGGAYAFAHYTGIVRHTKDFDLFILPADFDAALAALAGAGYAVERNFPHWLGKAYSDGSYVDLIFSSGNGLTPVEEGWFRHAAQGEVLGVPARLCPAEEMIWSKAFIMERERFDGADVAHLLHCCAERLDWQRLLARFGNHWRVLLSHLVLFGYIYPADAARLPPPVMETLLARLSREVLAPAAASTAGDDGRASDAARLCRGTILSRAQYLSDLENHGYVDARLPPSGNMSADEIEQWTAAIDDDETRRPGLALSGQPAGPPDR
jgi:hypothetical protein